MEEGREIVSGCGDGRQHRRSFSRHSGESRNPGFFASGGLLDSGVRRSDEKRGRTYDVSRTPAQPHALAVRGDASLEAAPRQEAEGEEPEILEEIEIEELAIDGICGVY